MENKTQNENGTEALNKAHVIKSVCEDDDERKYCHHCGKESCVAQSCLDD